MIGEAVIHIPAGLENSDVVLERARDMAVEAYGGVTILPNTSGHWFDKDAGEMKVELMTILVIAVPATSKNQKYETLDRIIQMAGRVLRQKSIYYKNPFGKVTYVPIAAE